MSSKCVVVIGGEGQCVCGCCVVFQVVRTGSDEAGVLDIMQESIVVGRGVVRS